MISMLRLIIGVFLVLHGLVHLLYFGQSQRLFELQPGLVWPDSSWAFSKLLGDETTRLLAGIALVLAAVGFVAGGIGVFARQAWWRTLVVAPALFSAVVFVLLWDGKMQKLPDRGLIGLLVNAAILVAVLLLRWPDLGF
jgi:hypothetical protein